MKKLLNLISDIQWKNVIGEILMIFVGISLAIWFNNWNSSTQSKRTKEIVAQKIKEEIESNLEELVLSRKENQAVIEGFSNYRKLFDGNSTNIITNPSHLRSLEENYPSFFIVKDSVDLGENEYRYSGVVRINLELAELTDIAWKTAQSMRIANKFSYACLYELESMYNLQSKIKNSLDKAADAMQDRDILRLMNILSVLKQLDVQLEADYRKVLNEIGNC